MTLVGSFLTQSNRANMTQQLLIHFIWNTSYQWKKHGLRFDQYYSERFFGVNAFVAFRIPVSCLYTSFSLESCEGTRTVYRAVQRMCSKSS